MQANSAVFIDIDFYDYNFFCNFAVVKNNFMNKNMLIPNYIFEISWEVCNKVGGIYTVLSTRAKTLQKDLEDKIFFVGPDLGQDKSNSLFLEDKRLFRLWRETAKDNGLKIRIGRWDIPGKPITFLVDFKPFYEKKDEIYAQMWADFNVDSIHGYGDYDEASMFSYAAGKVVESFYNYYVKSGENVIYQAHEWMSGMGMLYIKKNVPDIATIFTTHATSIGRSIAGNDKPLYDYFEGYNGDQMADELNMQSKHSVEKQTAHNTDCFTTVSEITDKECKQLLDISADEVLVNGFEADFVPRGKDFEKKRKEARALILRVANCLTGKDFNDETLIVSTSGRNDFRCKGFDVFMESLVRLNHSNLEKDVLALIEVPCWMKEPRADLMERISSKEIFDTPLDIPMITHTLHDMDSDRILSLIKYQNLWNLKSDKVHVILIPCYLDGSDGIFNKEYYDLLIGNDLCIYPSYYEPWGYTPLESVAFKIPCITTNLSGFGLWVNQIKGHEGVLSDGVRVIPRTDSNYNEVVNDIVNTIIEYSCYSDEEIQTVRKKAAGIAEKALWKHFIQYYYKAYDIAIKKMLERKINSLNFKS